MSGATPPDANSGSRWDASRVADLIQAEAARVSGDPGGSPVDVARRRVAQSPSDPQSSATITLDALAWSDHEEFVENAHRVLLGRLPTATEHDEYLSALLRGDAKTWLLGKLRYGAEGCIHAIRVPGLRRKYLAQRFFRLPLVGSMAEWMSSIWRLPRSLRYFRAVTQTAAGQRIRSEHADQWLRMQIGQDVDALRVAAEADRSRLLANVEELRAAVLADRAKWAAAIETVQAAMQTDRNVYVDGIRRVQSGLESSRAALAERIAAVAAVLQADLDGHRAATQVALDERGAAIERVRAVIDEYRREMLEDLDPVRTATKVIAEELAEVAHRSDDLTSVIAKVERDLEGAATLAGDAKSRVEAISAPHLAETLEIVGGPLVQTARERARVAADVPMARLSAHERYAVFEAAFYDSTIVAAKQRVYLPYIDRSSTSLHPFLDLGCGRGEFLRILAGAGIPVVGVDVNPMGFVPLRGAGIEVVEQDLLGFLEAEHRMFSGASVLQVAEHLTADQIEAMLALLARRLTPGAPLIVETPNPLCPFALGQFHTDPTHVAPLPPERMRFSIEAAGFEAARTLFQAHVPEGQFAGPDPRAYYMDYAIIAFRSRA